MGSRLRGLREAPLVLRVQLTEGQAVRLHVVTETPSLPALMVQPKQPRPDNVVPGRDSEVTWVAQEIAL